MFTYIYVTCFGICVINGCYCLLHCISHLPQEGSYGNIINILGE